MPPKIGYQKWVMQIRFHKNKAFQYPTRGLGKIIILEDQDPLGMYSPVHNNNLGMLVQDHH